MRIMLMVRARVWMMVVVRLNRLLGVMTSSTTSMMKQAPIWLP